MFERAPALTINDEAFAPAYFDRCFAEFEALPHLAHCTGRRYAVCVESPAEWLALCLYFRSRDASVAPLHANLPLDAAKRAARRLRCDELLFGRASFSIALDAGSGTGRGVLVQQSSGTTGAPKSVERTWTSVDREIASYNDALVGGGDGALIACPTTHSYGLISGVLATLARGSRPVILANINPKYVIRRALEAGDRLLYASPTLLHVVTNLLSGRRIPGTVMTSGAPLHAACFGSLVRCCNRVLQQYGCSEVGCISLTSDAARSPGDLGTPLQHLSVSAGTARDTLGAIRVRVEDELVDTYDLGYFSEGRLQFAGRSDDTINVAGVNVYPLEVEEVVLEFPGIADAVVYKRGDAYAGERVCVKFVSATSIDTARLRHFCATNLSPFAVPLEMEQVETIDRLANGKVDRRALSGPAELYAVDGEAP
jgi:3,4-dihydroxybenzoate---[aryl-carrier protein] ligase